MDVRVTCPFGHKCETAKDGYIERCALYVEMRGKDAAGEDHDEWRCSFAWQPILQVEVASTGRNVAASIQSLRNEQTKRQDLALQALNRRAIDASENIKIK